MNSYDLGSRYKQSFRALSLIDPDTLVKEEKWSRLHAKLFPTL